MKRTTPETMERTTKEEKLTSKDNAQQMGERTQSKDMNTTTGIITTTGTTRRRLYSTATTSAPPRPR